LRPEQYDRRLSAILFNALAGGWCFVHAACGEPVMNKVYFTPPRIENGPFGQLLCHFAHGNHCGKDKSDGDVQVFG